MVAFNEFYSHQLYSPWPPVPMSIAVPLYYSSPSNSHILLPVKVLREEYFRKCNAHRTPTSDFGGRGVIFKVTAVRGRGRSWSSNTMHDEQSARECRNLSTKTHRGSMVRLLNLLRWYTPAMTKCCSVHHHSKANYDQEVKQKSMLTSHWIVEQHPGVQLCGNGHVHP